MFNFAYQNPTKILFGKGQIAAIAKEIGPNEKVMITYGGGSIHRNGVYEQVRKALGERQVVEFGGIEPNPEYATLMKAVELARKEKVDLLLAVGGGSVADGTKFIGAAIPFSGEPWDILSKNAPVTKVVPNAVVLTLPATGSESNSFAVISRRETGDKLAFSSPFSYPRFAVLDPETTYSLPPRQVSNGIVDAFVHTIEQYLTFPNAAPLQDRFAESILQTLVEVGPKTLAHPTDYDLRANFVWSATMALNGLIGQGVPQDWATHMIGHELTALYGIDHARTLATVLPHLMRVQAEQKGDKLVQFAERVWGVNTGTREERIEAGVQATERFFQSLQVPTKLADYKEATPDTPSKISAQLTSHGMLKLGERGDITPAVVEKILTASLA